jgi:acyl-CoA reductase-like NAD-dependent aldehyde dehydrogenase
MVSRKLLRDSTSHSNAVLRRAGALLEAATDRFRDVLVREGGATGPKAVGEIGASVIEFYQAAELATTPLGEVIPSGQRGGSTSSNGYRSELSV